MAMPFMSPKHHHFHIIRYSDLLSHLAAAYCTIIYEISTNLDSTLLCFTASKLKAEIQLEHAAVGTY